MKIIIDTDPGIDDAMAILAAFNWTEEVEVIGLTTLFGNVPTPMATDNALILKDLGAQHYEALANMPVCQGSLISFAGHEKHRIADFVHGQDGFGNFRPEKSQGAACSESAAQFIVDQTKKYPGQVIVLALAALTNVALAMQVDPDLPSRWKELVVLGGAFQVGGNVNPAAEANFFGDPEAADYVFKRALNTYVIGLDVTHDATLKDEELAALRGKGKYGTFIADISQFYLSYHQSFYSCNHVYVHDPAAMVAVARKDLFTWHSGAVVVSTEGALRGKAVLDVTCKKWIGDNEWLQRPKVQVALEVKSRELCDLCKELLTR